MIPNNEISCESVHPLINNFLDVLDQLAMKEDFALDSVQTRLQQQITTCMVVSFMNEVIDAMNDPHPGLLNDPHADLVVIPKALLAAIAHVMIGSAIVLDSELVEHFEVS